ncbi:MAG TPA: PadR family transcriptional regulator [Jatrophihabitans sp.]|nr:PadR family transcriptional regulator [Jatrophihabitans sp.]
MSATRLLVLGAIRILAPVHGYDVRRELLSWRLEELTNIKPGSIYSAIRTLEKDGCIAVHAREGGDNRPERTMYVITGEGEKEFQLLLRETWWTVRSATEPLIPALCLMPFLPRDELIGALQARLGTLRGQLDSMSFFRRTVRDGATGADGDVPEHVREIIDFVMSKQRAEIDWTRSFVRRLQDGKYIFVGEPGFPIEQLNQT